MWGHRHDDPTERALPGGGDEDSGSLGLDLGALFEEFASPLYRALYAFTGRRAEIAEDVTAEAFARAVGYKEGIRDPRAWLYRTAFRLAAAEMRNERRHGGEIAEQATEDPGGLAEIADALCSRASTVMKRRLRGTSSSFARVGHDTKEEGGSTSTREEPRVLRCRSKGPK